MLSFNFGLLLLIFILLNVVNTEKNEVTDDQIVDETEGSLLIEDAAQALNVQYLSENTISINSKFQGKIFGINRLPIIALPVRLTRKSCKNNISILFVVSTDQSITSLTKEAVQSLYENCEKDSINSDHWVSINGKSVNIVQSEQLYADQPYTSLNMIGADFLVENNVKLTLNYRKDQIRDFSLEFDAFEQQEQDQIDADQIEKKKEQQKIQKPKKKKAKKPEIQTKNQNQDIEKNQDQNQDQDNDDDF